jgi:hypothetical protein
MIISVGYRVKSQRGIVFRRWANSVLKSYLIRGYAINERKLIALNKTVEIQNRMLASTLHIDNEELTNKIVPPVIKKSNRSGRYIFYSLLRTHKTYAYNYSGYYERKIFNLWKKLRKQCSQLMVILLQH